VTTKRENKAKVLLFVLTSVLLAISLLSCDQNADQSAQGASEYPRLLMTSESVQDIRNSLGKAPLFDRTLAGVIAEIDAILDDPIEVPVPRDMAGGYTHEQHKGNFFALQKAGALYQITDDEKYAIFVRDVLMEYAKLVPTLGNHPNTPSYAPGKLFWQCLNDANWLVYTSQAYDCVYNYLTEEERAVIERDALRPIVDHISIESPQFFNRIHNHSTWGIAGVGMMGIVMQDDALIERAMNGLKVDNIDASDRDNDGGFIKPEGISKLGFLAQIDHMFSPDGYYTEGPYYQRYAMSPFMMFSVAIQNNLPELEIFAYRDSVLLKAVDALINLSDADGEFFPLNDAQKGMSYMSRELVAAVDIVYQYGGQSAQLLSIAEEQGRVLLDKSGISVAKAIAAGKAEKFQKTSIELRDGADGTKGAIGILRSDDTELVMKYSSQGEGHGHFDKLSFSLYHDGLEVVQDYGLARFVNIDQKNGGGYLRENTTWAKQSIAHNTLVINESSHFSGRYKTATMHHAVGRFFDASDAHLQVMSAVDENAYPDVKLLRTMALIKDETFENPVVLDIISAYADNENQYDLPFHFTGHVMSSNLQIDEAKAMKPLGRAHGYQHLWEEANGALQEDNLKMSWLNHAFFSSLTSAASDATSVIFTMLGANDPEFNLRREQAIILRLEGKKDVVFASVIEVHGVYDPVSEIAGNAFSSISGIDILLHNQEYTVVELASLDDEHWIFGISNNNASAEGKHKVQIGDKQIEWQGPYYYHKQ
jgi:hypothetical protein